MCLEMMLGLIIVVKLLEDPAAPSRDDEEEAFLGKERGNFFEAQCLSSFHTFNIVSFTITSIPSPRSYVLRWEPSFEAGLGRSQCEVPKKEYRRSPAVESTIGPRSGQGYK
ncbi:unnamed protein product [Heligmosomoides polygyrus]|uniref:Secreted protein n=1 Tax=Heligmosomoides polygyrus TaxID=6339 RepID=A0A183FXD0_HELPZ|nr:unnamed protein product [Heligmosomoides polygyrus]